MSVRYLNQRISGTALLRLLALCAASAAVCQASDLRPGTRAPNSSAIQNSKPPVSSDTIIHSIEFHGLRRIPTETLRAHITSREGEPVDATKIEEDVRALDRLGWFDDVTAEVEEMPALIASLDLRGIQAGPLLKLVFIVEERPFLAGLDYSGSRVLSNARVSALLIQKGIALKLAEPVNRNDLWRAARAIEAALADERHPLGKVHIRLEDLPSAAVRATLEISDGPEVSVSRVQFLGNQAFSQVKLRKQMKEVAPEAHFAGLRGKDVYTPDRLQVDVGRLLEFYRGHGFPEARVGEPVAEAQPVRTWRLLPWPKRKTAPRYRITIPVNEGPYYRLTAIEIRREDSAQPGGVEAAAPNDAALFARLGLRTGEPYSQTKLERARLELTQLRELRQQDAPSLAPEVIAAPQFDRESRTARVAFEVRKAQPYTIRHIEFRGEQRFSDKYYRRRVLVSEGDAFDSEKLERGLSQLARANFIRPVKSEDIKMKVDEAQHTLDLTIRVQEIGRQRITLTGGHTNLGNTIGLVYNVFDLLGGEELITSHLEGGPESLQILLGVAKESVFGTRVSLGISLYLDVLRPALASHQRLFTAGSGGFGTNWNYPVTPQDTLGVRYQLSKTDTRYGVLVPAEFADLPTGSVHGESMNRTLGLSETHKTQQQRILASVSSSGGWLGGNENYVCSTLDYSRVITGNTSQASTNHNAWAFRGTLSGVSSFRGDLPVTARLLAGNDLVRGVSNGEIGPTALIRTQNPDGTTSLHASPAGADLIASVNAEYRVPLTPRTQAAAFFDVGSGWLLPNWLGPDRPVLAGGDYNLHAATGVELKWLVPGLNQTVRVHYAINPFHIRRIVEVAEGDAVVPIALPHYRRGTLGWALGSLF
jgi:outer membrane protein insertion porin family